MYKIIKEKYSDSTIFKSLLILFTFFNFFSAFTMGVHYDEAYYWLYSRSPAWGYFDHPPMIAWLIYAGNLLFSGLWGLRLPVVILSTLSIYNLWLIVKPYGRNALLFWSIIFSVLIIHPYAFIATPDAPLFFFATLFFVQYRIYLNKPHWGNTFLLALTTALLLYSKYHGVLVPFFVVLSNIGLLKKRSFWIYVLITAGLMVPHLLWQINHNFASLQYHLIDSHKAPFDPMLFVEYVTSQLLVAGPWFGWLFFVALTLYKAKGNYEKALKWTGIGVFSFFFVTTFGGDFEADWTYVAFVPLISVAYFYLYKKVKWHLWLYRSATVNIVILLAAKILVITPLAANLPVLKMYYGWDEDAEILKSYTQNHPVVFQDTWNKAARFAWHTQNPYVSNLNSGQYRKNQFDIWQKHEKLKGETVYVISLDSTQFAQSIRVETPKEIWYLKKTENFRSFYNLSFVVEEKVIADDELRFGLCIINPYASKIEFDNNSLPLTFGLYDRRPGQWHMLEVIEMDIFQLEANEKKFISLTFSLKHDVLENAYLMMKVGELKPVPLRHKVMD